MFDLVKRIFEKSSKPREQGSAEQAKERLKILLVHDRSALSPEILPLLKDEIITAISKYVEIDSRAMEISLTHNEGSMALVANIPVTRWKCHGVGAKLETVG